MAEKDDHQNLGGDLGLSQSRSLPELSSALPDIVPLLGITLAPLSLSDEAINDIVNDILFRLQYQRWLIEG
jgi:hypothetical protein